MSILSKIVRSILAGISIGVGALIYVKNPNPVGALLFSVGLLVVMWFRLDLFTGKLPYAHPWKDLPRLLLVFFGNIAGAFFLIAYTDEAIVNSAAAIVDVKIANMYSSWYMVLVQSIVCGALIYVAVEMFKREAVFKRNGSWVALIAVPAFILSGSEHCIADACYVVLARAFTVDSLLFVSLVAVGNFLGGKGFRFVHREIIDRADMEIYGIGRNK